MRGLLAVVSFGALARCLPAASAVPVARFLALLGGAGLRLLLFLLALVHLALRLGDVGVAFRCGLSGAFGGGHGARFLIKALDAYLGNLALRELLDVGERFLRLGRDEGNRAALRACAPRAPDAVHVILSLRGQIVVHDVVHLVDIDAAGEHVGCHQDVGRPSCEVLERTAALVLRAARVDGLHRVPSALQAATRRVGAAARAGEHDDALVPPCGDRRAQEVGLEHLRHMHDALVDRVGGFALVRDLHHFGVAQERARNPLDRAVDGGGEQKRLSRFRRGGDDLFHRRQKAHVEHAVGLVEHEHLHAIEMRGLLLHEVDQAPRRGDEHVGSAFQGADLRVVRHAAHDGKHAVVGRFRHGLADLCNLCGELARRGDDEHERPALTLRMPELIHRRKRESGGFSCSRLRGGNDVVSFEDKRDRAFLHGGRLFVAEGRDGGKRLGAKPQIVE